MSRIVLSLLLAILLIATTFELLQAARAASPDGQGGPAELVRETQGDNVREAEVPAPLASTAQPNIGFIDSPSASCIQPDPALDECYLNWYYMAVDANPNYMITMTAIINDIGTVSWVQGFFQTSMYVPYDMAGRGYKVACGAPGAGGNPALGNAYGWTIRARDSAGLASANYGTAYCPPYAP